MQSGIYFEYLCWDIRKPLMWEAVNPMIQDLGSIEQKKIEAAVIVIKAMTQRSFNKGGDNASEGNLAMTMDTRSGFPHIGGPERDWNSPSDGFVAISYLKHHHLNVLKTIGFLADVEFKAGYFEVRTHLAGIAPRACHLLYEPAKALT